MSSARTSSRVNGLAGLGLGDCKEPVHEHPTGRISWVCSSLLRRCGPLKEKRRVPLVSVKHRLAWCRPLYSSMSIGCVKLRLRSCATQFFVLARSFFRSIDLMARRRISRLRKVQSRRFGSLCISPRNVVFQAAFNLLAPLGVLFVAFAVPWRRRVRFRRLPVQKKMKLPMAQSPAVPASHRSTWREACASTAFLAARNS